MTRFVKPIEPVQFETRSAAVNNLQKGLLFLIMHEPGISDNDRSTLQGRLAPELQTETYGPATLDLVRLWQEQLDNRLDFPKDLARPVARGQVDQQTADALNWLLRKLGAFS